MTPQDRKRLEDISVTLKQYYDHMNLSTYVYENMNFLLDRVTKLEEENSTLRELVSKVYPAAQLMISSGHIDPIWIANWCNSAKPFLNEEGK